jgi:hypothetical protein
VVLVCVQEALVLRGAESAPLQAFSTALVTPKSACAMLTAALAALDAEALRVQWLCSELEVTSWAPNVAPAELQRFVKCERAAAARIRLFGASPHASSVLLRLVLVVVAWRPPTLVGRVRCSQQV